MHGDVIGIEIARSRMLGSRSPMSTVAGGYSHDDIAVSKAGKQRLIGCTTSEAWVSRAQRQIDRVATQNDRIFDGGQIIGVIGATIDAKDLHDHKLCIRCHTHSTNGVNCLAERAVCIVNIPVGGSNASHMGSMAALLIPVVIHISALIVNVVVAKGHFGVLVQIRTSDIGNSLFYIHQGQNLFDFLNSQSTNVLHPIIQRHIRLGSL